jgi:hypothetical protein
VVFSGLLVISLVLAGVGLRRLGRREGKAGALAYVAWALFALALVVAATALWLFFRN